MSTLLDTLKTKPIPKKRIAVEINVPATEMREGIALTTRVEDKRREAKIDRATFMADFKDTVTVVEPTQESLMPIYDLEPAESKQAPQNVYDDEEKLPGSTTLKIKKPTKKRRKKLTLVQE